jgi:peptidoglycan hydrolase-like protein with peptidoglycan-binding domain
MIRKLLLGTASVLALGIGGAALDFSAGADQVAIEAPAPSQHWIDPAKLSKDDYRWVQAELHAIGLYNGSLDGVAGPETERALFEFQKNNGFKRTGKLDQETADALTGGGVGEGSSTSPTDAGSGSLTRSSGPSDADSRTRPN